MNKLFTRIGGRVEKTPFKTLFITIIIFAIMIAGAIKINMATGSETLVKTDNDAYISNYAMEQEFGGDAIMVLFEGEQSNLFKLDNMQKMWNVEQRLKYNDGVFTFMSPASIVHQITDKQETEIKKQLPDISNGLRELGAKLKEIGEELGDKELPDPRAVENKLDNLIASMDFDKLIGDVVGRQEEELKKKLLAMGNVLPEMATGGGMLPDSTDIFSSFRENMEQEIASMKDNLSGGISPDELKTMSDGFITMGENLNKMSNGLSTFHEKSGMMIPYFPHNQKELDNILYEDGNLRDIFSDTIIDENHMMLMIKLEGNLGDDTVDSIFEDVSHAMEEENFDVNYIVSGKPVLDSSLRTEMKSNMVIMVVSAVVLMFIILSLIFRVRWRVLSLGIIFVSVIATLGLMGHLNVSMTMVSMAVFPILIGLGIDYSIQFQNRYEEEQSVKITLIQIGKAVGLAVLATVLGFVSLFASPVPMIQDFGKMLTIGVIVSFVGSIFLLMPILGARDTVASKARDFHIKDYEKATPIDKFLKFTVNTVIKLAPIILIVSVSLATFGLIADTKVGVETDIETFMPQDMDALHDIHHIRDIVGSTNQMVVFMEEENLLSEGNLQWMRNTADEINSKFSNKVVDIKFIDNLVGNFIDTEDLNFTEYIDIIKEEIPAAQRKMFINDEMNKGVILMNVEHMATAELQEFVEDINIMLKDAPVKTSITGKSVLDVEMVKGLTDGRLKMTVIGLGLVFVALLILYRSFFKASVAVLPVILIVGMSGGVMKLLGLKYTPITATLGALVLGMGTEMTIMLLERYLEERHLGKEKKAALLTTIKYIGKATLASGLTTVGGFSVLMTSKFVILKDFGLMTVINISLALMATFVILPALIWMLDRFIVKEKMKKEMYKELVQE